MKWFEGASDDKPPFHHCKHDRSKKIKTVRKGRGSKVELDHDDGRPDNKKTSKQKWLHSVLIAKVTAINKQINTILVFDETVSYLVR